MAVFDFKGNDRNWRYAHFSLFGTIMGGRVDTISAYMRLLSKGVEQQFGQPWDIIVFFTKIIAVLHGTFPFRHQVPLVQELFASLCICMILG